jgi:putative SOS response-associated peptidase YedK
LGDLHVFLYRTAGKTPKAANSCEANELVKPIHDRMPVIVRRIDEDVWIDPTLQDVAALQSMLRPYPAHLMRAVRVNRKLGNAANDTPDVLTPEPENPPVRLG